MLLLDAQNLFRKEAGATVVDGVSIRIFQGMKLGIVGETGSGKTTLMKMLSGFSQPSAGIVKFEGKKVEGPDEVLIPGHKAIAYLSQHFELRNNYRVHEILEMASKFEADAAKQIYADCKIDHLLQRWTDELSGGEKQRIALARLLTTSPRLLLLDEPFSNLDTGHKKILRIILNNIAEHEGVTMAMVSHDGADLLSWANHMIIMQSGKIVQEGTPVDLYIKPLNEYCAGLLGDYSVLQAGETGFKKLEYYFNERKEMMVRPEQFKIVSGADFDLEGTLAEVAFHGLYSILLIRVGRVVISVKADENIPAIGSRVLLRFRSLA